MGKVTQKLEKGQKVIFSNGITGKIVEVDELREQVLINVDKQYAEVYGYNGVLPRRMKYDDEHLAPFYLLGKNVIGNKADTAEIERDIAFYREEKAKLEQHLDVLRKQLFVIRELMRPDWREREEERHAAAIARKSRTRNESEEADKE